MPDPLLCARCGRPKRHDAEVCDVCRENDAREAAKVPDEPSPRDPTEREIPRAFDNDGED